MGKVVGMCCWRHCEFEERLKAVEATLDAHENAVLALAWITASIDRDVAKALPGALRLWAARMREDGKEMSAFATEELANRMVRSMKAR